MGKIISQKQREVLEFFLHTLFRTKGAGGGPAVRSWIWGWEGGKGGERGDLIDFLMGKISDRNSWGRLRTRVKNRAQRPWVWRVRR